MDERRRMPAGLQQELDALHSPPSERSRRFGARLTAGGVRGGGGGGFEHSQAPAFARTAGRLRRDRHENTPDFDFSGDDGRHRHHHQHQHDHLHQQQQGAHRLANAEERHPQPPPPNATGGKYAKLRASGAAITPGASLVVTSGERHLSQKYLPPAKQTDFLENLAGQSARRAATKPAGGPLPPRPVAAMASPARSQRMKAPVSVLELGSAPSPTRPTASSSNTSSDNTSQSEWTPSAAAGDIHVSADTTRVLGWKLKPRAAAAPAAATTRMRGKPRVDLTPKKDGVGKKRHLEPTRSSTRQLALAATREATSSEPRRNIDVRLSLATTASITESVMRRTTRQRAAAGAKKTDGTADQPIHLDLDSDSDNDASPPRKRVSPPEPPLASKRKAKPSAPLLSPPHWKNVDLDALSSGTTYADAPVWIGRVRCVATVCLHAGTIWLTAIRATMMPWHYMPHLQLSLKALKGAYFYRFSEDRAPMRTAGEDLKADERVVMSRSFLALDVACSHAEDQEILRPFYDPRGSDDAKRYIVIEAADYDVYGGMMKELLDVFQTTDEELVTALEDSAAAKAYLKALMEEPYVEENDSDDGDDVSVDDGTDTTNGGRTRRSLSRSAKEKEDSDGGEEENFEVQLTYPLPPCSSDIVTITRSDISRLRPGQYLNDNLIDYFFKRLMIEDFSSHPYVQKNVLFLSSHFYSRLRMGKGTSVSERLEAGYKNVSTWLTRADLFRRSMVFIPINKDLHWSLAIILNPRAASNQPPSRIAVLDPLGAYHNKQAILRNLRSFLQFEWERTHSAAAAAASAQASSGDGSGGKAPRRRQQTVSKYNPSKVELLNVKAPQQQNSYDCGVYVIKFASVILDNYVLQSVMFGADAAISKDAIDNKLEQFLTSNEFCAEKIAEMRGTIKEAIEENALQYHAALEQQRLEERKLENPESNSDEPAERKAEVGAAGVETGDDTAVETGVETGDDVDMVET